MKNISCKVKAASIALFVILLCPSYELCRSEPYMPFGARGTAMGGAITACPRYSEAPLWNPAALALGNGGGFFPVIGLRGEQHKRIYQNLKDLWDLLEDKDIDDPEVYGNPELVFKTIRLLEKIDEPGAGFTLELTGAAGFMWRNFSLTYDAVIYGGVIPDVDLENINATDPEEDPGSIGNNQSAVEAAGIWSNNLLFSAGYSVLPGEWTHELQCGIGIRLTRASTYYDRWDIWEEEYSSSEFFHENKRTDSAVSYDLGLIYKWNELQLAFSGKNMNRPRFKMQGGNSFQTDRHLRLGAAYHRTGNFTVSLDADLNSNNTATPPFKDRRLAFGAEKNFLDNRLFLRGGINKNIAESSAELVYSAGLGFGGKEMQADFAMAYESGKQALAFTWGLNFQLAPVL